ncbi:MULTISPECIES: alpha/beta hydrolase [unclassified Mycobacterium]|uniref:alpha/beta fold hydrolase n=1 Tax=unclassified Mycobacterium TaxID=2642494 RepID=UPI0007400B50|nr:MULTISPECIES: alpha/beta hydrolase [unclassified Mycobacterium]KUH84967.1 alpha/beta hydrolase [Mycobacterium sp. GA-0227b]KUH87432.1 alpha/beta hydrolase [Mycobacterium sp. GA-1999]
MTASSPNFVSTDLCRLHVRRTGAGPPVVLWHSLFVDSRSWGALVDTLARDRTVYTIDGPSHGKSEAVRRDFAFEEVVAAAEQALDRLGITEPVDWVGNAWGGHIGIWLAAADKPRLRTLTTIGTPVRGFTMAEKLTKGWPLVEIYRFAGPNGFIMKQLSDSLLGAESVTGHPEHARVTMAAFRDADRSGMYHAMRSMMLKRAGVEGLLADVKVPTLVMSVREDVMGWRPEEARRTCTAIPDCRVEEVAGTGHVSPLLVDRDRIVRLLSDLWSRTGGQRR